MDGKTEILKAYFKKKEWLEVVFLAIYTPR
jgi:hypothetical protein